jgi:uncharacterized protein (UPF0276 family)
MIWTDSPIAVQSSASAPRALGVGLLYNGALSDFLHSNLEAVDYLAITPDLFWLDHGPKHIERYEELESWIEVLEWVAPRRPIVCHNIGLSIGSAESIDKAYLEQIARFHKRYRFQWHSDHLSFAQVRGGSGEDHNAGLAVPIPFLLENNVYFVDLPEQDMTEVEFLNRLVQRGRCGLLLDLHNLYTNARNHGFDALKFLDQLDLSSVTEIHIAGGDEFAGMYTDSHAGACPEPVAGLRPFTHPKSARRNFRVSFLLFPAHGRSRRARATRTGACCVGAQAVRQLSSHVDARVPEGNVRSGCFSGVMHAAA